MTIEEHPLPCAYIGRFFFIEWLWTLNSHITFIQFAMLDFKLVFFFFYLMYFFLRILLLNVWEILYNLFHIFLLHFWGFKLSKFIVFIMLRTISGCSQTIDGDRSIVILIARKASASLLGGWQIFFPLLSNQRKNSYLRTITYSVRVHDFRSNSVKLL